MGARKQNPKGKATQGEQAYLMAGLDEPGGKLPLFDDKGQRINEQTILSCLEKGYAERWFANPLKPDWLVCRLTAIGRAAIHE